MIKGLPKIEHEAFYSIYSLIEKQPWLATKTKQLVDLYNLCDNKDQQDLILDLLRRFIYVNSELLERNGWKISDHVINHWKCDGETMFFIATADKEKAEVDGSQALLNSLKNKFEDYSWSNAHFVSSIGKGAHCIKNGYNAILFDDFIGTGETITRKYNWFVNKLKNLGVTKYQLMVVSYAIMEESFSLLEGKGIVFYTPVVVKKGISGFYEPPKAELLIQEMKALESKLEEEISNRYQLSAYSLGYGKSESIYALERFNISDNVFPIF